MYNKSHFIDAFYRVHGHQEDLSPEPRSVEKEYINLTDKGEWDAKDKRIINVTPGKDLGDVVTTDQALLRDGSSFKVGRDKYEFMATDNKDVWNARKRKLVELSAGESEHDAVTVSQIMSVNNDAWEAKKKKISNVVKGTKPNDVAIVSQIITKDGEHWNCDGHKVINVKEGSNPNDVAVYSQIPTNYIKSKDGKWHGDNKIISNVAKGTKPNDVAIVSQIITKDGEHWNCDGHKVINVKEGSNPNDVAVYSQIPTNYIKSKDGKWYGDNKIISNVAKGIKANDVAIISQIPKDYLPLKQSKWNGNNKIIENVAKGTKPNDVAVMSQIPKDYLQSKDGKWNGDNKKITSVGQGTEDNDVAIVRQLPTDYMKSVNSSWDAGNRKITNVKEGTQPNDVLTFNQALKPSINKGEFYTTSDTTYKFMQPVTYKLHGEQLPTGVIVSKRDVWDAQSMPIRDIAPGYYETDACRVDQALVCNYPGGEYYDAIGKQICNIKPGTKYGDALVFEQSLRIENNELYVGNTKLELYFIESNGDQVRVRIQSKEQ